jgi:uncharacterized DUF497 family protein
MVKPRKRVYDCTGFQWDDGNDTKNWDKHDVSRFECEQVFFNQPLVVRHDSAHGGTEIRLYALGRTDAGRLLFVAFTIGQDEIRVISARDMTRAERQRYPI